MKPKPIEIPDDIAAKCDDPGQFERFDTMFSKLAEEPKREPAPKKPRGRPKKK